MLRIFISIFKKTFANNLRLQFYTEMENYDNENIFQCDMCVFKCISYSRLMQHYIRNHKQDPYFRVTCVQPGCGATFKKWKSFRQHLFRKHSTVLPILNEATQQIEDENQLNHDAIMLDNESFEGKKCFRSP